MASTCTVVADAHALVPCTNWDRTVRVNAGVVHTPASEAELVAVVRAVAATAAARRLADAAGAAASADGPITLRVIGSAHSSTDLWSSAHCVSLSRYTAVVARTASTIEVQAGHRVDPHGLFLNDLCRRVFGV